MVDEQKIICPNCEGYGWRQVGTRGGYECGVCDGRGSLVIDHEATQRLRKKTMPRGYANVLEE